MLFHSFLGQTIRLCERLTVVFGMRVILVPATEVDYDFDGLVQERRNSSADALERRNSSADALELRLSCTNPSICN